MSAGHSGLGALWQSTRWSRGSVPCWRIQRFAMRFDGCLYIFGKIFIFPYLLSRNQAAAYLGLSVRQTHAASCCTSPSTPSG
jgi:hypothetical protein